MSTRSTRARRATAYALLLALTPVLVACGSDEPTAAPAAERTAANGDTFNDADVAFASDMIPHHADALVMVDMTQGRDLSPELAQLTEDIRAAQAPEIEQMADWLTAWGEKVPETSRDHVNSHDMGSDGADMGMDGDDLAMLEDADGSAFEDRWLTMMIEHHEGAIEMAQEEQESGLHPGALALAESIEADQTVEITLMEQMLDG
ncbi:Uncharacterized conserved protein, DUF305 family [Nocardioides alpinus]|uniref:DUF305 domain-containing protein n=1 Tax=Nocardioides alpinus TaxID=748909 RepID=A0A1I0Y6P7_9ACTN|nr:DUF305 domain-containing protein [Nocardioides alpinus]PKH39024.1 DUF305 domain-containing protein [Nocardioides alpinus]SFB08884.1 Uncharacterized conserved protein, DUF305 family [Nocardioides alpinus]